MQSEEQPYIIDHCICNCPIYRVGEQIQYSCGEYPCYPQKTFDLDEEEDE